MDFYAASFWISQAGPRFRIASISLVTAQVVLAESMKIHVSSSRTVNSRTLTGHSRLVISVPATLAASRLLKSFLFETRPNDPGTLVLAGVVLLGATILAGYAPARTASRIDPLSALRRD